VFTSYTQQLLEQLQACWPYGALTFICCMFHNAQISWAQSSRQCNTVLQCSVVTPLFHQPLSNSFMPAVTLTIENKAQRRKVNQEVQRVLLLLNYACY